MSASTRMYTMNSSRGATTKRGSGESVRVRYAARSVSKDFRGRRLVETIATFLDRIDANA